ncbi:MAG: T9SS type A sorting domain-containing protein [Chitinophagales bacterium]
MRQLTIKTIFFLLLCTGMSLLNAQVTLKKSNFPVQAGTDVYYSKTNTSIATPSEGSNQLWDYSEIPLGTQLSVQDEDASNDPGFPNASIRFLGNLNFQGFEIPNYSYLSIDETGYKNVGNKVIDTSFPIGSITGGANDVLRFPPIARPYEGGTNDLIRFPANYKDQWSDTYIAYTDFELTVGAFGLNQTPGVDKQYLSYTREVVGYGELIIPLEDGTPSDPVEVLLLKVTSSRIDSFFVGGFPAPPALLGAFGTTQGAVTDFGVSYSFYAPDFPDRVLFIDGDGYQYRPQATHPQPQLTITKANFPRQASFTRNAYNGSSVGVPIPTTGVGQVWDYSSLVPENSSTNEYFDATNSPIFPEALNVHDVGLAVQAFDIESERYEAVDETGWYEVGRTVEDVTYPISPITGGANDILRFPAAVEDFEGRIDIVQFPMSFGKQWTQTDTKPLHFEISVAGFGLNQVPGEIRSTIQNIRTVVGEGKLILPAMDGSGGPTLPMDVLLVKVESTKTNNYLLGGGPMPVPLLNAFGVAEGETTNEFIYQFFKPNGGAIALAIGSSIFFFEAPTTVNPCGDGIQNGTETGIDCGGPACAPCGDLCVNALPIQCGDMTMGNTLQYTNNDLMEACNAPDRNADKVVNPDEGVWYTFVGTGEAMQFSTDHPQTNFDTNIQIFKGHCGQQQCVAEDEDGGKNFVNGYTSVVVLNSVAGETYYLYLSGFYGEQGNYKLTMNCYPPIVIQVNSTTNIPLRGTTTGAIDVTVSGGPCNGNVSFSWTGPGDFTATTEDISELTQTGVYTLTVTDCLGNEEVMNITISHSSRGRSRGRGRKADIDAVTQLMAAPNPFADETMIHFHVDTDEQVLMEVFDIRGAKVATLFDGTAEGGQNYQVAFGSAMPTGTYIAKLTTANGEVQHIKLLLAK